MLEQIGKQIRDIREKSGQSQNDIAEKAETTYQTLSQIELGKRNISVKVLLKIAKALGKKLKITFE